MPLTERSPLAQARHLVEEYKAAEQALQAAVRTEMTLELEEPMLRAAAKDPLLPEDEPAYRRHRQEMILARCAVHGAQASVQAAKFQVQLALATMIADEEMPYR